MQSCNKTQKILPLRLQASHMIFGLLIAWMYSKRGIAILNWYCSKVFVWDPYYELDNKVCKHQLLRSLICNFVICWRQTKMKKKKKKKIWGDKTGGFRNLDNYNILSLACISFNFTLVLWCTCWYLLLFI